jgi:fluoride exporter
MNRRSPTACIRLDGAMKFLLIALGGGAGSLARYLAGTAIMTRIGPRFPWGTLTVNVSGSFLIGLLMTLLTERFSPNPNIRLLLVVGFLGGYTTFSSFEWETYSAIREGGAWIGLVNVVASVALGYAAVWLGALAAKRW